MSEGKNLPPKEDAERLFRLSVLSHGGEIPVGELMQYADLKALQAISEDLEAVAKNLRIANIIELAKLNPQNARGLNLKMPEIIEELGLPIPEDEI